MLKGERARKTGLVLLSVFIVWHAIGTSLVGPLPQGQLKESLMKVYGSYLTFFHLNNSWWFYAPNPFLGSILRYETVNSRGEKSVHPLSESRDKFDHAYSRYINFYGYLLMYPKYSGERGYTESVARYLCGQHAASEKIVSIRFLLFRQQRFTPDDYLQGKRPFDEEFLKKTVSRHYPCPQLSVSATIK